MIQGYQVFDDEFGWTATIYHIPADKTHPARLTNDFSAHEHPPSILKYYGVHKSIPAAIVLEVAEQRNLFDWRRQQLMHRQKEPDLQVFYRWAYQAVEALEFAHSLGILNSDIHCVNFFLDNDLNLKVGDWAGASIDGGRSYSSYRLRHTLFDADGKKVARRTGITVATEIFALGSAFYYMVTGFEIWQELLEPEDDAEIKRRLSEKEFPDISHLPALGDVMQKCWHVEYTSMTELKQAIQAQSQGRGNSPMPLDM